LVQSFTARMHLLMTATALGLGRRHTMVLPTCSDTCRWTLEMLRKVNEMLKQQKCSAMF